MWPRTIIIHSRFLKKNNPWSICRRDAVLFSEDFAGGIYKLEVNTLIVNKSKMEMEKLKFNIEKNIFLISLRIT